MIREVKYETKICHTCDRPGWVKRVHFNVLTEEEQIKLFGKHEKYCEAPDNAENLWVGAGSTITEAIKEAKELAITMNKTMVFEFNEKLVIVKNSSDVDELYRKWWQEMYNETPEESFAKR